MKTVKEKPLRKLPQEKMETEEMIENRILAGNSFDILKTLPEQSVDCCVTSPPYYGLRDYGGMEGQIGLESTPEEYVKNLVSVFREVKRVLKKTGTLWVVIGDSYNGSGKNNGNTKEVGEIQKSNTASQKTLRLCIEGLPAKSIIGIPWRFALAMQEEWLLRQDIIWAKQNPMPEPCKDRFCRSHEYIFLFSKQRQYYFNHENALEDSILYRRQNDNLRRRGYVIKSGEYGQCPQHHGGSIKTAPYRTMRDVWFIATEALEYEHYAMYPERLVIPCVLCGCPGNGIVLDPFMGSGTTAVAAMKHFRKYIGIELNPEYIKIAEQRVAKARGLFDNAKYKEFVK